VYNATTNAAAYIEDYYGLTTPLGSGAALNTQWKLNATTAALTRAATTHPDALFWTFATSNPVKDVPPETPRIMALGDGTEETPKGGVNQRLVEFWKRMMRKRAGIVMFGVYDTPGELVPTMLELLAPERRSGT